MCVAVHGDNARVTILYYSLSSRGWWGIRYGAPWCFSICLTNDKAAAAWKSLVSYFCLFFSLVERSSAVTSAGSRPIRRLR